MDYYGDGQPLADMNDVMPRIMAFMAEPSTIRARATEALAVLARQPECDPGKLAAIGYCFGGTTVLELARSGADLKAVVGFHSGLSTTRPAEPGVVRPKILACIGAKDPIIPGDQRRPGFDYHEQTDRRSWAAMIDLFDETLGPVG
jgi:dienelactone hydrolase